MKGADLGENDGGLMTLDFSFAYHPSCAWNDAWSGERLTEET